MTRRQQAHMFKDTLGNCSSTSKPGHFTTVPEFWTLRMRGIERVEKKKTLSVQRAKEMALE